jgi:hypothetical protein
VDTTIRVRDGENHRHRRPDPRVRHHQHPEGPVLGDLPFFGQLFKKTEKNRSRSEIVIFITSRVLKD